MRRVVWFAACALAASPLAAARPSTELPLPVDGPPATVADVQKSAAAADPLGAVVPGYGFGNQSLVAVVINAPGRLGTFFRTDLFMTNGRNLSQEILVFFLPAGVSNAGILGQRFLLNPNTTYSIADYLGTGAGRLNKSGVGSLLVFAVLSGTNTTDSGGLILLAARIWTPEPGFFGTNSFTEWGTSPNTIHGDFSAIAIGGCQNSDFRANYAVVNLDRNFSRSFAVTVITSSGSTSLSVTVPPLSVQQVAFPSTITGGADCYLIVVFTPVDTVDFQWYAIVFSADNDTGDAWPSPAQLLPSTEY